MANGSQHTASFIEETTYGVTPATPAFKALRHTAMSLSLNRETLTSEELRSDRMIPDVRGGAQQVDGDIEFELSATSFDDLLAGALCGNWATNVLKAGIVRKSFTIERRFADLNAGAKQYHRFTGCEIASMELSVQANAFVTGSFKVIGQGMLPTATTVTGATYAAPPTTDVMDSFTGALTEAGAPIAVVTEISLSLENGHEPRFVVGSKNSLRPSIARSNVSGTMTAYFEDGALLDKYINDQSTSLEFTVSSASGSLKFTIPKLKFMGGQPDVKGEGPVLLSMPFQAILDPTAQTNLIITRVP